ncbi:MAG: DNA translocase FtsK, partial [Muribaculaceae bacterium]|nr:DNA translocase FtsK [Muribaculaceae bacterium]
MNNLHSTFPLDLLSEGSSLTPFSNSQAADLTKRIVEVFKRKGMDYVVCLGKTLQSPTLLRFEFIPDGSIKMRQLRSCEDDLNEVLKDYGPVRLIAPVPGKGTIAVEVPCPYRQIVRLREILESYEFKELKAHLPIALGVDSENNTVVADLAKMPHLLIAGSPGQGKSVLLNNIILSLISRLSPDDLKLVMIDTKMVEFSSYDKIKT